MPDYLGLGHIVQINEDHSMDDVGSEEEHMVGSINQRSEPYVTTPGTYGVQTHHHRASEPGGFSQNVEQHQTTSHTPMQHDGGNLHAVAQTYSYGSDPSNPFVYIIPVQTPTQETLYGQGLGHNAVGQQYHGGQCDGQDDTQMYEGAHDEAQYYTARSYDGASDTVACQGYGLPSDHSDPSNTVSTTPSAGVMLGETIGRLDDVFIPGFQPRNEYYQEELDLYTDRLVHHLDGPGDNSQMLPDIDRPLIASPPPNAEGYTTFDRPQLLHASQQQAPLTRDPVFVAAVTDTSVPMYVPRRDTFVVSGSSRLSSDDHLRPGTGSWVSGPPSPTATESCPEILGCDYDDCNSQFTGRYRKGNLGRHRRQKHGEQIVEVPCEDESCNKVFQRKDARLRHYRKEHLNMNPAPAVSRKASSSTGIGSPHVDEYGDSHDSGMLPFDDHLSY